MKKFFPQMSNKPSTGVVVAIFICWFMCFIFIPFVMPLLLMGAWDDLSMITLLEIIYHTINGILMAFLAKEHLGESFVRARMNPKRFIGAVAIACALMISTAAVWECMAEIFGGKLKTISAFPVAEFEVLIYTKWLAVYNPVFGTISLAVFSPIAVSVLFYVSGFATLCCGSRKWLAYVMTAFLLLLLSGFDILWRDNAGMVLVKYLLRLPIHLLACWSYQKTNSVWAPIISLALFNLVTSIFNILYTSFIFGL